MDKAVKPKRRKTLEERLAERPPAQPTPPLLSSKPAKVELPPEDPAFETTRLGKLEVVERPNGSKINKWGATHARILMYAIQGWDNAQIAQKTKYSKATIGSIRNDPWFTAKLARWENRLVEKTTENVGSHIIKARDLLTRNATRAAKKIIRISRQGSSADRMQFDASIAILNMAGLKPVDVVKNINERTYSKEEVESALTTARELENLQTRLTHTDSSFLLVRKTETVEEPSQPGEYRNHQSTTNDTGKNEGTIQPGEDRSSSGSTQPVLPL